MEPVSIGQLAADERARAEKARVAAAQREARDKVERERANAEAARQQARGQTLLAAPTMVGTVGQSVSLLMRKR